MQQPRKISDFFQNSFSPRVTPIVAVLITAALGLACFAMASDAFDEDLQQKSAVVARSLSTMVLEPLTMGEHDTVQKLIAATQQSDKDIDFIAVIENDGSVIASTSDLEKRGTRIPAAAFQAIKVNKYTIRDDSFSSFEIDTPIGIDMVPAVLQMGISKRRMGLLQLGLLLRIILGVVLASAISWSLMKYVAAASRQVSEAVQVLRGSVDQILSTIADSIASSKTTAESIVRTTSTVEELKRMSELSCEQARNVFETAQRTKASADVGQAAVEQTENGMSEVRSQMDSSTISMVNLLEKSRNIGQIIAAIDDLSRQSSLLSINAAIEAAKAGDHALGFTAVATEMKQLAAQSKKAIAQIRVILEEMQDAAKSAADGNQVSVQIVEGVFIESKQANKSIMQMSDSVLDCATAAGQIASASEQQAVGAEDVLRAIFSIRDEAEHNVEVVARLEKAGNDLSALGNRLSELIKDQ